MDALRRKLNLARLHTIAGLVSGCVPRRPVGRDSIGVRPGARPPSARRGREARARMTIGRWMIAVAACAGALWCVVVGWDLGRTWYVFRAAARGDVSPRAAVKSLAARGPRAVPALRAALREDEKDGIRRMLAAEALGMLGPEARDAVPDLVAALRDRSYHVRRRAVDALGQVGPGARPAIPILSSMITRSWEDPLWVATVEALCRIGPEGQAAASAAVPTLVEWLNGRTAPNRRSMAARLLTLIGPAARDAIPALETAAASDPDPGVRRLAAKVLKAVPRAPGAAAP